MDLRERGAHVLHREGAVEVAEDGERDGAPHAEQRALVGLERHRQASIVRRRGGTRSQQRLGRRDEPARGRALGRSSARSDASSPGLSSARIPPAASRATTAPANSPASASCTRAQPGRPRPSTARAAASVSRTRARPAASSDGQSSENSSMPPVAAIAIASVRASSSESCVSRARAIRQSGSFSHRRRCIQARASTLRTAARVEGSVSSIPGIRTAGSARQLGRDVGPDPHAVHDAHRRAEGTAAAEQEGPLAGAGAHRVEPGAQPLRAAEPGIEGVGLQGGGVEEVELQVVEAQRPQLAEDGLEMRAHLGPARVEHVDGGVAAPGRMQQPAQPALSAAQQPLAVLREETALRDDAEGRGPDPRDESGRADLRRERRQAARKPRVRLQPIADRALVAVVDLDRRRRGSPSAPPPAPRGCAARRPRSRRGRSGTSCTSRT